MYGKIELVFFILFPSKTFRFLNMSNNRDIIVLGIYYDVEQHAQKTTQLAFNQYDYDCEFLSSTNKEFDTSNSDLYENYILCKNAHSIAIELYQRKSQIFLENSHIFQVLPYECIMIISNFIFCSKV